MAFAHIAEAQKGVGCSGPFHVFGKSSRSPELKTCAGGWSGGQKHGHGRLEYPSGTVYIGQFLNGRRHGKGTQTTAKGDVYNGDWVESAWSESLPSYGAAPLSYSRGRVLQARSMGSAR